MSTSKDPERKKVKRHSLKARIQYRLENFFSQGGRSMFISLIMIFISFLVIAIIIRIIIDVATGQDVMRNFLENLWLGFMNMIDPGSLLEDRGPEAYYKFTAVFSAMVGVVILSMLIAFITTQLELLFTRLKKGHSTVIEKGHVLILGWNERVPDLVDELIASNEITEIHSIVILSEKEKEEMDDELAPYLKRYKGFKVITRNGVISSLTNLERVSARDAKSAIILASCSEMAPEEERQTSDAMVIKTILAMISLTSDLDEKITIIAELYDDNRREMLDVFKDERIISIDSWDILGKILVQTSMSSGLATVFDEILSFKGADLMFVKGNGVGKTFRDLIFCFPRSIPIGIKDKTGKLILRPDDMDVKIKNSDSILLMTKNDPGIEYKLSGTCGSDEIKVPREKIQKEVKRQLILGWHPIASVVITEYEDYLLKGSVIDVMVHKPSDEIREEIVRLDDETPRIDVSLKEGNPLKMEDLLDIDPFSYDAIIILSQSEGMHHPEKVDSETLVILLLLRKVFRDCGTRNCDTKLITQVMNSKNQDLIARTEVDDFIISNRLITMLMAQICEDHTIMEAFRELFSETGSEIYLKPAYLYFHDLPRKVSFADMINASIARKEICIGLGHERYINDPERNFGIRLSPLKDKVFKLHPMDKLIVLSENEL